MRRYNNIKNVEFILITQEVVQDLRNEGYIQSSVVEDGIETKQVLKDVGETTNIEKVYREMELAVAELMDALYPFTRDEQTFPNQASTNSYNAPEIYRIRLLVPYEFAQVSLDHLKSLCHEYVKARCMQEFTRVALPSVFESWSLKVSELLAQIDHVKNRRIGSYNRGRGCPMI